MNDYKEKTDDIFYLHLARNQLALIREENKKWQHPWGYRCMKKQMKTMMNMYKWEK